MTKWYVVSEEELQDLKEAASFDATSWGESNTLRIMAEEDLKEADAACRARPVPEWAEYMWASNGDRMQCMWEKKP